MMDAVQSSALLVDGVHHPPLRLGNMGTLQHHFFRLGVILPATPGLEVHWTQFPLLEWIVDAAEEPDILLLVRYREPVFQQTDARTHQHAFELRYRTIELLVLF